MMWASHAITGEHIQIMQFYHLKSSVVLMTTPINMAQHPLRVWKSDPVCVHIVLKHTTSRN